MLRHLVVVLINPRCYRKTLIIMTKDHGNNSDKIKIEKEERGFIKIHKRLIRSVS